MSTGSLLYQNAHPSSRLLDRSLNEMDPAAKQFKFAAHLPRKVAMALVTEYCEWFEDEYGEGAPGGYIP